MPTRSISHFKHFGYKFAGRRHFDCKQLALGLLALSCCCPCLSVAQAQSGLAAGRTGVDKELHGLQSVYLRGPVRRYYADANGAATTIAPESLKLTNFTTDVNRRLYPGPDGVRAAISANRPLATFLSATEVAGELRSGLDHLLLYAELPHPGESGFAEFNTLAGGIGNPMRPAAQQNRANIAAPRRAAAQNGAANPLAPAASPQPSNPSMSPNSTPAQPGFLGDIQKAAPQRGSTPAPNRRAGLAPGNLGQRLMVAQRAAIRDLTACVGLSADGSEATLYVLGSLPGNPNPGVGINFTVQAKLYGAQGSMQATADRAANVTLLDKQTLARDANAANGVSGRYFCFAYPLVTPPHGTQFDLLVSYWTDTSAAITHAIALTHSDSWAPDATDPAADWIAIPMTRLLRFQPLRDTRHAQLASLEPGDPVPASLGLRRKP